MMNPPCSVSLCVSLTPHLSLLSLHLYPLLSLPQRPSSLISDSSVEPVPSPSGSSQSSSSSTPSNDVTSSAPNLNATASTVNVKHRLTFFWLLKWSLKIYILRDIFID